MGMQIKVYFLLLPLIFIGRLIILVAEQLCSSSYAKGQKKKKKKILIRFRLHVGLTVLSSVPSYHTFQIQQDFIVPVRVPCNKTRYHRLGITLLLFKYDSTNTVHGMFYLK